MQNKVILKDKLVSAMFKCMVSMVTRYIIFKNECRPTKSIESRVIHILEHKSLYQIKA